MENWLTLLGVFAVGMFLGVCTRKFLLQVYLTGVRLSLMQLSERISVDDAKHLLAVVEQRELERHWKESS